MIVFGCWVFGEMAYDISGYKLPVAILVEEEGSTAFFLVSLFFGG